MLTTSVVALFKYFIAGVGRSKEIVCLGSSLSSSFLSSIFVFTLAGSLIRLLIFLNLTFVVVLRNIGWILFSIPLMNQLENIEVFLLKVNVLLLKAFCDKLGILADWFVETVNLLKHCLHECPLERAQKLHFLQSLLCLLVRHSFLTFKLAHKGLSRCSETRSFDVLQDAFGVEMLPLLDLLLNGLRVEALQIVRLNFEVLVKIFKIPNEVMDRLTFLLLDGKRNLYYVAMHAAGLVT